MNQPTPAISVWHWTGKQAEYIVAAAQASDAVQAVARFAECRGKVPQAYSEAQLGSAGRRLAVSKPGAVYRRLRPAGPATPDGTHPR